MQSSFSRTLIIGNSGSGKSTLSTQLSALLATPAIDLDTLHWEAGSYGVKRDENTARQLVRAAAGEPRWIMEGVFGWLADVALPRATALLWLDLPWEICREGLVKRGLRRGATDQDHAQLLEWAEAYWDRKTPSSFAGHLRIFESFSGEKFRLGSRQQQSEFLKEQRAAVAVEGKRGSAPLQK